MIRTVAIYARVSTASQTCSNQLAELREIAARAGWQIAAEYTDEAISGGKGRRDRPALDRMLKDAVRKKFSTVAITAIDRLGRSLPDLLNTLGELHGAGVDLFVRREAVDTATPTGRAQFQLLGLFSEFERALIRERVLAGLARARAEGRKLGRPPLPASKEVEVRDALAAGYGTRRIARELRVGLGSVVRIKARMAAEAAPAA